MLLVVKQATSKTVDAGATLAVIVVVGQCRVLGSCCVAEVTCCYCCGGGPYIV